jgi:hypothetical protein
MQIITIDDRDFSQLLDAWKAGRHIGRYTKNGKVQIVIATRQFMLISSEDDQKKIAIKPSRSQSDAENFALQFLLREEQRGSNVEFAEGLTVPGTNASR